MIEVFVENGSQVDGGGIRRQIAVLLAPSGEQRSTEPDEADDAR